VEDGGSAADDQEADFRGVQGRDEFTNWM